MPSLLNVINKLSRTFNKWIMTILGVLIFSLLLSIGFDETSLTGLQGDIVLYLWVLFSVISFFYTLNGILLNTSFNASVKKYLKEGKPVQGIRGFMDLKTSLKGARNLSIAITFGSIISFALFFVRYLGLTETRNLTTLAIAFAFIVISVLFLVEYPEDTSFSPGGLIGFYEPDIFPLILDNLLTDVFLTYLDPATFMEIDEWINDLTRMMETSFEEETDTKTRVERTIEKVLLLAYLHHRLPEIISVEVLRKELIEIVGEDDIEAFLTGKKTGLTFPEIKKILLKVEKEAPEVFRLVDRLMIQLTDNYDFFRNKTRYFSVSAKTNQGSIKESAGILVYLLNKTNEKGRKVKITLRADRNSIQPDFQEVNIGLDALDFDLPAKRPEIVSSGEDILTILNRILQVGDTIWFRLKPNNFGYKVVTIQVEEKDGNTLMGQSVEMKFTKSISFYVKSYLPKLSALGGVALPVIQGFFGI